MEISILHNESKGRFFPYEPGTPVQRVMTTELDDGFQVLAALELVYAIANSYPEELHGGAGDYPELVAAYRQLKVRSLSVGDVVVVDGVAYAVARMGFDGPLAELPPVIGERPEDHSHAFKTFLGLPPSTDDKPICGAELPADWTGKGKPMCPTCEAAMQAIEAKEADRD